MICPFSETNVTKVHEYVAFIARSLSKSNYAAPRQSNRSKLHKSSNAYLAIKLVVESLSLFLPLLAQYLRKDSFLLL